MPIGDDVGTRVTGHTLKQLRHVRRGHGHTGGGPKRERDAATIEPAPLKPVGDVVERRELTAVEGHDQRNVAPARDRRGHDRRHALVRVEQIQRAVRVDGCPQSPALQTATNAARTVDASDVVHCRAEQRIAARFGIIVKDEHVHLVAARETLDEPQQARRDALPAGAVEAAGDDETDAHAHQASHEGER